MSLKYFGVAFVGSLLLISAGIWLSFQTEAGGIWLILIIMGLSFSVLVKIIEILSEKQDKNSEEIESL